MGKVLCIVKTLSDAKLKEVVFVGLNISNETNMKDTNFVTKLS